MSNGKRPGPTEPMIGALLRLASEATHRALFEGLQASGFDDIRPAHFALFGFPGPHGARPTELAERAGLSKQALNPLLNELEDLGYLTRQPGAEDKRHRVLCLTARGVAFADRTKVILEEIERTFASRLGERRFTQARAVIARMPDLLATNEK